jgi:drug/metabolite transporter (DMT)-like permease
MRSRWIIATILILVGLVWVGQGTGLIRSSSPMTDDARWAVIGIVLVVAGAIVAASTVRRRATP